MGGADVPDLDEQRIRRAVRQWFHDDEQSRALLERLAEDPIGNETALRERVDRSAPDEVRTYLRVSGGNIEKLVNIAKAEQLHIYQGLSGPRPLVRLFLKPLSDKLQIGAGEPCVVVARIENRDTVEREVELKITGWLSDFSEIEGGEQFVVPASGHVDRRINIAVSPIRAAALPAGQHSLEAQVAVQRVESALAWAESSATLQVPPFQRVHAELNPSGLRCRDWRGQWVEYQLVVENRGNQPAGIEIDGDFDAESLVVETPDGQVNLSLGSRKELAIRVRPARYNFFPAEQVYQFRLYASLENGDRADVPGQLSHPSFFSRNRKIGLVAVAVVLAALLFPSLGSQNPSGSYTSNTVNGKPLPSKTPTPTANSTGATRKDPVEVVRDFYDAVNDHQYERAWALIDDTKLGMSYEKFVRGFAHTDHVDAEISKTGPDTVRLRLIADEYGYSRKSVYGVSYRVHNGLIHSSTRQKKIR